MLVCAIIHKVLHTFLKLSADYTTMRPVLLDLFCGAGGASKGYVEAGFDVVGIDNSPQPHYPYRFIQMDALDGLSLVYGARFDAIHASPPCQKFSAYRRKDSGIGSDAPDLITETRRLLQLTGLPYIIENIPNSPLLDPVQLCGSSFGLDIRRHRWFESNITLTAPACDHSWQTPRFPPAGNRTNLRRTVEIGVWRIPVSVQRKAMGIDWMSKGELSQAVPPAYTRHLGEQIRCADGVL